MKTDWRSTGEAVTMVWTKHEKLLWELKTARTIGANLYWYLWQSCKGVKCKGISWALNLKSVSIYFPLACDSRRLSRKGLFVKLIFPLPILQSEKDHPIFNFGFNFNKELRYVVKSKQYLHIDYYLSPSRKHLCQS